MRATDVDLAGGQEDVHADVDEQAALDFAEDLAGDDVAFGVVFDHLFPLANAVGFAFREDDQSEFVFDFFKQDRYLGPGFGDFHLVPFAKLVDGHHPLALVTDVDENIVTFDSQYRAFDDRVQFETVGCGVVDRIEIAGSRVDFLERVTEGLFEVFVGDTELANEIAVDHGDGSVRGRMWPLRSSGAKPAAKWCGERCQRTELSDPVRQAPRPPGSTRDRVKSVAQSRIVAQAGGERLVRTFSLPSSIRAEVTRTGGHLWPGKWLRRDQELR